MNICAGVVLYNPNIERLKSCVDAVRTQVDRLVLIDNASENLVEVLELFTEYNIVWIRNDENFGIAKALNQLVEYAGLNGFDWVLTLDQDSVCEDGFVRKLVGVVEGGSSVAMVAPVVVDRGLPDVNVSSDDLSGGFVSGVEDIKFCITSGCLTNVKAIQNIGWFNEWLFVYDVDREICIRLLRAGYRLVRVNGVELYHEHGLKTVYRRFFWKKVVYRNYSPTAVYYMTRNLVFMLRKYGSEYTPHPFLRWVRLFFAFFVKFIFESGRMGRLKAFCRGVQDGFSVIVEN